MDWKKLKDYKCPKCKAQLEHQLDAERYTCTEKECDFSIGKQKFHSIVTNQTRPKYKEPDRSNWDW